MTNFKLYSTTLFFIFFSWHLYAQDTKEKFEDFLNKGQKFRYENVDSSLFYLKKAMEIASTSKDPLWIGTAQNHLGAVYYIRGAYNLSMEAYTEAYRFFEKAGDKKGLAMSLNGLGLIHLGQREFEEAINRFSESLELAYSLKDTTQVIKTNFNLGIANSDLKRYDKALEHLRRSKALSIEKKDTLHMVMNSNRIGRIFYETGQLDSAKYYYQSVLAVPTNLNKWERSFVHTGQAEVALKERNLDLAVKEGLEGFAYAKEINAFWDLQRASAVLSESYEASGKIKEALDFARLNKLYSDSLYTQEKAMEINFLGLQLSEAEKSKLEQENKIIVQQAKLNKIFAISLAIVTVLLGVMAWFYRRNLKLKELFNRQLSTINRELEEQKEKISDQNKALSEVNNAKNKLFSILSHDLRAPIGTIKQFLEMDQLGYFDEEEREKAKSLLYEQVKNTDKLLNNLLEWAKTQLEGIQPNTETLVIGPYVKEVVHIFEFQSKLKNISIKQQEEISDHSIKADKGHLRIILQNIINNAIKFTQSGGNIQIAFSEVGEFLNIHIKDSGIGMDEKRRKELEENLGLSTSNIGTAKETGTGLGLMLVKQLVAHNHGKFKIKSTKGKGTEIIISFPKA